MIVYHEVSNDALDSVLEEGLVRTSRGEKGDDSSIAKTDELLDGNRPAALREIGISRDDNLYAYLSSDTSLIDITDGSLVPLDTFIKNSDGAVLALTINAPQCYVSDLDQYDAVKEAVENDNDIETLQEMSETYWNSLVPLDEFTPGDIDRPEVMIPYDILPENIEQL